MQFVETEKADGDRQRPHGPQQMRGGTSEQAPGQGRSKLWRRRVLLLAGLAVVLIAALAFGVPYILHARAYESTDDAFVEGHIIQISPKLAGYVSEVLVNDNQLVHRGDVLVKLDARDQQARLTEAQAALAAAQSRLAESRTQLEALKANVEQSRAELAAAQANAELAQTEWKRYEAMAAGAASPAERSNAQSAWQAAQANVEAARSKVASAQASVANGESRVSTAEAEVAVARTQVAQAELDLGYTVIASPDDGRVTRKSVEPGAYVQQGQALLAIVPPNVWVLANFKETQLTDMKPGQPVDIRIDAYPRRQFKGHVDSIQRGTGARFSLLPPENATGNYVKVVQRVPVKIVFDGPTPDDLVLAPGMSVVPDVKVK